MSEEFIGKAIVVLFLVVIGGLLISLIGGSLPTHSITQFNGLIGNINTTAFKIETGFSAKLLLPINQSNPDCVVLWVFNCSTNPVANGITTLANVAVFIVNFGYELLLLLINVISLIIQLVLVLGFILIVLLPSLLSGIGIVGYIAGLAYTLVLLFFAYKYGFSILKLLGAAMGVIK